MDVESFAEGILGSIVVNEGERANVGASIAFIAESEADLAEAKKKGGSAGGAAAAPAGECGCICAGGLSWQLRSTHCRVRAQWVAADL